MFLFFLPGSAPRALQSRPCSTSGKSSLLSTSRAWRSPHFPGRRKKGSAIVCSLKTVEDVVDAPFCPTDARVFRWPMKASRTEVNLIGDLEAEAMELELAEQPVGAAEVMEDVITLRKECAHFQIDAARLRVDLRRSEARPIRSTFSSVGL